GYSINVTQGDATRTFNRVDSMVNWIFSRLNPTAQPNIPPVANAGNDQTITLPVSTVTLTGTATDADGNFTLQAPDDKGTLVISYVGFETLEIPFTGDAPVKVTLKLADSKAENVVVVAYGTQQKAKMTSSQSSISADDFKGQPVSRVDQAIQGRASGVQVTNTTGAPGGDVRIRVRGANSINGNNDPLYVIDGFIGGNFNTINPTDIADIQVLKDAAATAPYGSRGANGVVIITTKKGSRGKVALEFSTRQSLSKIIKTYDVMGAADYAKMVNERNTVLGIDPYFTDAQINEFEQKGGTDWQKEIYRKAPGQRYDINITGGNDNTNYFISGAYENQDGIINNSNYKYYSLRSNINTRLSNKVSTYVNMSGYARFSQNNFLNSGTANPVVQSLAWSPTSPVYTASGSYTKFDPLGSTAFNPVAETTDRLQRTDDYSFNLAGGLNYKIIQPLTLNVQYGLNFNNGQYKSFGTEYVSPLNYATRSFGNTLNLQNINTLTYKTTFNDLHSLEATGVLEVQTDRSEGFNAGIQNLIYPSFRWDNLSLGTSTGMGSSKSEASLFSLFGRVNYSYKDKYLLSGTIRRDGSSKFRGNNKFSYFPSVSAGWVITKEGFMQQQQLFTEMKLRGSWGKTGNQAVGPYSTMATYANTSMTYNTGGFVPGIMIDMAENPDLKWETTEQKDIGLDLRLKPLGITVNFDYFIKDTRDLLIYSGLPSYVGGGGIMVNVGNVRNTGLELTLGLTPVKTKNFSWNTSLNGSILRNKVIKLSKGGNDNWNMGSGVTWDWSLSDFRLKSGQSMGAINGLKYLGTWKPKDEAEAALYGAKPGDSRYEDINGDHVINNEDFQIIGNGFPQFSMGWNNSVNYKNFELSAFMQGMFGFDKMNYIYAMAVSARGDFRQPTLAEIKDRYIPGVNETSDIPAFSTSNQNFTQTSRFISKADFLRIKNVSLTYTLPRTALRDIATLRVFVSVTNLYTFTKYSGLDPESSNTGSGSDVFQSFDYGSYPIPRIYTGGLTITF
ncbi:MAG: SusC/RagA family TonB-linked outer membrane protein, partial [Flavihumibacter sp.]